LKLTFERALVQPRRPRVGRPTCPLQVHTNGGISKLTKWRQTLGCKRSIGVLPTECAYPLACSTNVRSCTSLASLRNARNALAAPYRNALVAQYPLAASPLAADVCFHPPTLGWASLVHTRPVASAHVASQKMSNSIGSNSRNSRKKRSSKNRRRACARQGAHACHSQQ
jgi:hypothetical protein